MSCSRCVHVRCFRAVGRIVSASRGNSTGSQRSGLPFSTWTGAPVHVLNGNPLLCEPVEFPREAETIRPTARKHLTCTQREQLMNAPGVQSFLQKTCRVWIGKDGVVRCTCPGNSLHKWCPHAAAVQRLVDQYRSSGHPNTVDLKELARSSKYRSKLVTGGAFGFVEGRLDLLRGVWIRWAFVVGVLFRGDGA